MNMVMNLKVKLETKICFLRCYQRIRSQSKLRRIRSGIENKKDYQCNGTAQ